MCRAICKTHRARCEEYHLADAGAPVHSHSIRNHEGEVCHLWEQNTDTYTYAASGMAHVTKAISKAEFEAYIASTTPG